MLSCGAWLTSPLPYLIQINLGEEAPEKYNPYSSYINITVTADI